MADEVFTLDSLLEDLDAVVTQPKIPNTKYIPHPPSKGNVPNAPHNPKTKFAVQPGSSQTSPDFPRPAAALASTDSHDADENSIDNLLNLISSPIPSQLQQPQKQARFSPKASAGRTGNHTTYFDADARNRGAGLNPDQHARQHIQVPSITGAGAIELSSSACSSPFDSPSSHGSASGSKRFHPSGSGSSGAEGHLAHIAGHQQRTVGTAASIFSNGGQSQPAWGKSEAGPGPSAGASLPACLEQQSGSFLPPSLSSAGMGGPSGCAGGSNSKLRCSRVTVAGTAVPRGRKVSSFTSTACDSLRCLQCNFRVHCFSGSAWDTSVDYMFLRNTVPNEAKLAARLLHSAGSCAYCCQCSSLSEAGERELVPQGNRGDPQWICAGH